MSARPRLNAAVCVVLLAALCLPSITWAAWPRDPAVNVPVSVAANNQVTPVCASDGTGGMFIAWTDNRAGNLDIYIQRIGSSGTALWAANGVPLCTRLTRQENPTIIADGTGGAIVTWQDERDVPPFPKDIFAQRVNASGVVTWALNGVEVCGSDGLNQDYPEIASDGAGGAFITWQDGRGGPAAGNYIQHLNAAGVPLWAANGIQLTTTASPQYRPRIVADGAGGAIAVWEDAFGGGTLNLFAQRVDGAGVRLWGAAGALVCGAASDQRSPVLSANGAGGAVVAWEDYRNGLGNPDIFVQELDPSGESMWTDNGVSLCTATGYQLFPSIQYDGVGGAFVGWYDARPTTGGVYARRIDGAGVPQWAADGVALTLSTTVGVPSVRSAPDGTNGALFTWAEARSGSTRVYVQRVSGAGAQLWTASGVAVSTGAGHRNFPTIAADISHAPLVAWEDTRNGGTDIYAQRLTRSGALGGLEPTITSAKDVPNDQGGRVLVLWKPSDLDGAPANRISAYDLWRRILTANATTALARGASLIVPGETGPPLDPGPGVLLKSTLGIESEYWEFLATVPGSGAPGYGYAAPTTGDSTAAPPPWNVYLVGARDMVGSGYYVSPADSGYSVDNVAPAAPAEFVGVYLAGSGAVGPVVARTSSLAGSASFGSMALHWTPSPDADFDHYALYRGASAGFTPGPSNLLSTQADTGYVDENVPPMYYKLFAVDLHGNASGFALVDPTATVAADEGPGSGRLWLGAASPSPTGGSTTIRFGLPREAEVSLGLYDARGRRVRLLARGRLPVGDHQVEWDGRNDAGQAAAPGLYLYRLAMGAEHRMGSVLLVR